jgi:lysophospholipase L1-like esterase
VKVFAVLTLAAACIAQPSDSGPRLAQLMESTAVAVPGLVNASESLRHNADETLAALKSSPQDPGLTYRLMNELRAYLALSETLPQPTPFPPTADQQFSELRDGLYRLQQQFENGLAERNARTVAEDADPANLKRFAEENARLLPPGKMPRVVFLGDSAIASWRLNEYFTGRDFVNRGISGQTTLQMVGRFLQDVVGLHPKAVLILAGVSDIGNGISPPAIEDDLTMLGDLARVHGIRTMFASILPVGDSNRNSGHSDVIRQVNRWLEDYCKKEGLSYVNFYAAIADAKGQLRADLSDDGLNPDAKGYRVMSSVALEAINRILAAADQKETAPPAKRRFGLLVK